MINDVPLVAIAGQAIQLARAGLQRVAADETPYLDLLEERVTRERLTNADILIRNFEGAWHGDIRKVIADCGLRIAD